MEMPEDADEKRREKVKAGRQKMLAKAMEKYRFKFEPLCLPDGLIVEDGQLVGLRFRRTRIEGNRVVPPDETFERRGCYMISSIGSVPKEIPGIPMKGELLAFTDWEIGRLAGYPTVFSAGNVVTGKGNIVASRKHAREVTEAVLERSSASPRRARERARGDRGCDRGGGAPITRGRRRSRPCASACASASRRWAMPATTRPGSARARRRRISMRHLSDSARRRPVRARRHGLLRGRRVTVGHRESRRTTSADRSGPTTRQKILRLVRRAGRVPDGEIFSRLTDVGDIAAEDLVALPFARHLVYEIIDETRDTDHAPVQLRLRVDLERDRLVVFFDENNVVLYYGLTRQRDPRLASDAMSAASRA